MMVGSQYPTFRCLFACLLAVCLVLPKLAFAAPEDRSFSGRVVAVADGDTVTVLDGVSAEHKVRLSGIDAPEKAQPFGQRSKESLSRLSFGKQAEVRWSKTDRYGRIVGKLVVGGKDVCLEQIRRGMAWHYEKYANEQPERDRIEYARSHDEAKRIKLGLWAEKEPIPPWQWRKTSKQRAAAR
jgi:endonuclease YncB( thermonuclease family)